MAYIFLLLSVLPNDYVKSTKVDYIEVNHFYGEDGQVVFDQLIFWEFKPLKELNGVSPRDEVVAWRLIKNCREKLIPDTLDFAEIGNRRKELNKQFAKELGLKTWPKDWPLLIPNGKYLGHFDQFPMTVSENPAKGRYYTLFYDGPDLHKVYFNFVHESWSQFDAELTNREFLPKEKRRELK